MLNFNGLYFRPAALVKPQCLYPGAGVALGAGKVRTAEVAHVGLVLRAGQGAGPGADLGVEAEGAPTVDLRPRIWRDTGSTSPI